MMRDIEFRGKRSNGEWVYGSLIALDADSGYVYITKPYTPVNTLPPSVLIEGNTYLVDLNTVGQYTGLKDKNGVKIYEDDIIKNIDGVSIVFFDKFPCGFYMRFLDAYDDTPLDMGEMWDDTEVIGNIHDDPELL